MKTAAILEDFNWTGDFAATARDNACENRSFAGDGDSARYQSLIRLVREQTGADYLIAVMSGDFLEDSRPAAADKYRRAAGAVKAGVDMVLEIPVCAGLSDLSGKAFSGVAMLKRLYSVDDLVILCHGVDGQEITRLAKFLFAPPPEYKKKLSQLLHGRPGSAEEFQRAQLLALKACYPTGKNMGAEQVFSDPVNRYALEIQMAMYQFYWIKKPVYVDSDSYSGRSEALSLAQDEAFATEIRCLRRKLASLKPEERKRLLLETPGGTPELCEQFEADKLEKNLAEVRAFLLKLLIGMKRGDQIICGLRSNCPYGRVLALKDESSPGFLRVKEKSWIPLLVETTGAQKAPANKQRKSVDEQGEPTDELREQADKQRAQREEQRRGRYQVLDECGQILAKLDDNAHELYLKMARLESEIGLHNPT